MNMWNKAPPQLQGKIQPAMSYPSWCSKCGSNSMRYCKKDQSDTFRVCRVIILHERVKCFGLARVNVRILTI